jgi:hypothetical protein
MNLPQRIYFLIVYFFHENEIQPSENILNFIDADLLEAGAQGVKAVVAIQVDIQPPQAPPIPIMHIMTAGVKTVALPPEKYVHMYLYKITVLCNMRILPG